MIEIANKKSNAESTCKDHLRDFTKAPKETLTGESYQLGCCHWMKSYPPFSLKKLVVLTFCFP